MSLSIIKGGQKFYSFHCWKPVKWPKLILECNRKKSIAGTWWSSDLENRRKICQIIYDYIDDFCLLSTCYLLILCGVSHRLAREIRHKQGHSWKIFEVLYETESQKPLARNVYSALWLKIHIILAFFRNMDPGIHFIFKCFFSVAKIYLSNANMLLFLFLPTVKLDAKRLNYEFNRFWICFRATDSETVSLKVPWKQTRKLESILLCRQATEPTEMV
jgi:hypothetical protein